MTSTSNITWKNCQLIENVYYCGEPKINLNENEINCISKISKNESAACELLNGMEISTIHQPEPNYILCKTLPETKQKQLVNQHSVKFPEQS